jgi:flagellar hook protein FlgE
MTLFNAINSALSGLQSEAERLSSISNNVANSSTVGYKKADTLFESMVLNGTADSGSNLAGVQAKTRMDISSVGQVSTTGINTDLAVNGSGFFVVNTKANSSAGAYMVTRAGSFRPDAAGNLVNSGGYYLQGLQLDSAGQPVTNTTDSNIASLTTVNVGNLQATASATTEVTFNANLPSTEATATSALPLATHVSTVSYYDALGNEQTLTFTFTPTPNASPPTGAVPNSWEVTVDDSAAGASVYSATVLFSAVTDPLASPPTVAGTMEAISAETGGTYDATTGKLNLSLGSGGTQSVTVDIGMLGSAAGMTQYNGAYSATKIQKDGASFGLLQGISVDGDGKVIASFSNGFTRPIYQLELAVFTNPDGLTPASGGAFAMDPAAGVARLYRPGDGPAGSTQGGALEGSNVDISTELTNLIATQRAYSSNATVIQTSNQMLDVANRLNQ